MKDIRVAVLRGGPSEEYEVSLKTGSAVIQALREKVAGLSDVVITRQGEWLQDGRIKSREAVLQGVDIVFLALHGSYGEDGEIQKYLQRYNIPFTGSRSLPSAIAFNKHLTKKTLAANSLPFLLPAHQIVTRNDIDSLDHVVALIESSFGPEYILKPNASGSSVGIELLKKPASLKSALAALLQKYEQILVEEYILGREATCAVLENFRDTELYVFPVVEIIPPNSVDFFSYQAKYSGETAEICPGNFSYHERDVLQESAKIVHNQLQLSQYSRSDFIVRNGKVYFLEVNTLPGLTPESLFPKAAAAVGLSLSDLVELLVRTAKI